MKRKFELVDIIVSIGMVATLLGAYAFFQVSVGGAVTVNTAPNHMTNPPMNALVQAKLQPAMGQAIVEQAVLERQFAADMNRGASNLASAIRAAERQPRGGLDQIDARAAQIEAEHTARVQYVMGRSIIMLTKQGMRSGALSTDNLSNSVNDRIIESAQERGRKMDRAFAKNWQPRLGQWIVAGATQERRYAGHVQERIGQATVDLASIQHAYQRKRAGIQTQFKALTAAAARTAEQPDLFARLPKADPNWQWALGIPNMPQVEVVEARTASEIPFTYLMAASAGLVAMFFFGLTLPRGNRNPEPVVHRMEERKQERYRKAV
ncbi:MAG: hypothetical protein JSU59_01280 [Nitrospirota bacterium]|nr:MAG: hypothetical protein JSU59_01280 [Nitrospirota bacterium]